MKVLIAHNYYRQSGGEDVVFEQETAMLQNAGHEVIVYARTNHEAAEFPRWKKATLPLRIIWAEDTRQDLRKILRDARPDIAHFHNTHYMITPAAYEACREFSVPVVQSLHNPRLLCPAASFTRHNRLCQDCLGKTPPWPSVLHGCYRNSRVQTGGITVMLTLHRWRKTWKKYVDTYIVATEFYRQKFIEGGLSPEKIVIKPHFITPDPGVRHNRPGQYALFIGRLDPEKGVPMLLQAWQGLEIPLKIRGTGRLFASVQALAEQSPWIDVIGRLPRADMFDLIKGARFLVWPSKGYYETFGLVAVEAFACGVPVIASRTGVAEEIVEDHCTGLHFEADDIDDLVAKVTWAWEHPDDMRQMGQNARHVFEEKYTQARNSSQLIHIYQQTIDRYFDG